jgi:hypothetical protein
MNQVKTMNQSKHFQNNFMGQTDSDPNKLGKQDGKNKDQTLGSSDPISSLPVFGSDGRLY